MLTQQTSTVTMSDKTLFPARLAIAIGLPLSFLMASAVQAVPSGFDEFPYTPRSTMEGLSDLPCIEGMAGDFQCHGVDLLAYVPLEDMGCEGNGNDIWGWTDPETGTEYALMGCNNGIAFMDLSDPEQPVHVGNLPSHTEGSLWRDSKVFDDHAFVVSEASGHGLQVFDLSQLREVEDPPVEFENTAHLDSFGNAHNIEVNVETGYAYVVGSGLCSGGLHIVDINDPNNPEVAGCYGDEGYTHDTQCVIYQGPDENHKGQEVCFNSNPNSPTAGGNAVTIVDVTEKDAPVLLSSTGYADAGYSHQGWLTEDHRYFLFGDELDEQNFGHNTRTRIWDVADLENPEIIGIFDSTEDAIDHNMYVVGDFVYQSNYTAGLRILDLEEVGDGVLSEAAYFNVVPHDHSHGRGLRHGDGPNFSGTWSNYPFFDTGIVVASSMGVSGEPGGLFVVRPHLEESSLEGVVTRSDTGEPLEDVEVQVIAGLPHDAVTAPDGSYEVAILPGTYGIVASKPGYYPAEVSGIQVTEGQPGSADVALDPAPTAGFSPVSFALEVAQGGTDSEILEISNAGEGELEWSVFHDQVTGLPDRHDADLDEVLALSSFNLPGGGTHEDSATAGIETQGQVTGFTFEGTVSGISGTGTWASDMQMTIISPEGVSFQVGGFGGDNPWDFSGSGSSEDGTYDSTHIGPDIFGEDGTVDEGQWSLYFEHTWNDPMDWSDVSVTLHKTPLPICEDPESVDWLSADPDAGTTGPGQTSETLVTVDAAGLDTGTHEAHLCLETNDPLAPLTPVPVEVTVIEPPPGELAVDTDSLDFGTLVTGNEAIESVIVMNAAVDGAEEIELAELSITQGKVVFAIFGGDCEPGTLLAGQESCEVKLSFAPDQAGSFEGLVIVEADEAQVEEIQMAGAGQDPGELVVEPAEYDFGEVWVDRSESTVFTVSNEADEGAATFEVSIIDLSGAGFEIGDGATCQAESTELVPGDSCTIEVDFVPDNEGEFSGHLNVEVDDGLDGQGESTGISGTGVEPPPIIHEDRFEAEGEPEQDSGTTRLD